MARFRDRHIDYNLSSTYQASLTETIDLERLIGDFEAKRGRHEEGGGTELQSVRQNIRHDGHEEDDPAEASLGVVASTDETTCGYQLLKGRSMFRSILALRQRMSSALLAGFERRRRN